MNLFLNNARVSAFTGVLCESVPLDVIIVRVCTWNSVWGDLMPFDMVILTWPLPETIEPRCRDFRICGIEIVVYVNGIPALRLAASPPGHSRWPSSIFYWNEWSSLRQDHTCYNVTNPKIIKVKPITTTCRAEPNIVALPPAAAPALLGAV